MAKISINSTGRIIEYGDITGGVAYNLTSPVLFDVVQENQQGAQVGTSSPEGAISARHANDLYYDKTAKNVWVHAGATGNTGWVNATGAVVPAKGEPGQQYAFYTGHAPVTLGNDSTHTNVMWEGTDNQGLSWFTKAMDGQAAPNQEGYGIITQPGLYEISLTFYMKNVHTNALRWGDIFGTPNHCVTIFGCSDPNDFVKSQAQVEYIIVVKLGEPRFIQPSYSGANGVIAGDLEISITKLT